MGHHVFSCRSLLLSAIVLNDYSLNNYVKAINFTLDGCIY